MADVIPLRPADRRADLARPQSNPGEFVEAINDLSRQWAARRHRLRTAKKLAMMEDVCHGEPITCRSFGFHGNRTDDAPSHARLDAPPGAMTGNTPRMGMNAARTRPVGDTTAGEPVSRSAAPYQARFWPASGGRCCSSRSLRGGIKNGRRQIPIRRRMIHRGLGLLFRGGKDRRQAGLPFPSGNPASIEPIAHRAWSKTLVPRASDSVVGSGRSFLSPPSDTAIVSIPSRYASLYRSWISCLRRPLIGHPGG
jgi:hypothetical protein